MLEFSFPVHVVVGNRTSDSAESSYSEKIVSGVMHCPITQLYLFLEQLTQRILPCTLFCSRVDCTYREACFICYIVYMHSYARVI